MKPGVKDVFCNHCSVVLQKTSISRCSREALGVLQNLSLGPKNFLENLQLLFESTERRPLEAAGRVLIQPLTSMGIQIAYLFGFKIFHWNFQFDRTYKSKSSSVFSILFKV